MTAPSSAKASTPTSCCSPFTRKGRRQRSKVDGKVRMFVLCGFVGVCLACACACDCVGVGVCM
jgi:hypothetical protein